MNIASSYRVDRLEPVFGDIYSGEGLVTMPSAAGLQQTADKGFQVLPLLQTEADTYWNELQPIRIDQRPVLEPSAGERKQAYTTALALSRTVGGHRQRIVVVGDADCMNNNELTIVRSDRSANNPFTFGIFKWLVYDRFPVNVDRLATSDDRINLTLPAYDWLQIIFAWGFPILLIVAGSFVCIRRKLK